MTDHKDLSAGSVDANATNIKVIDVIYGNSSWNMTPEACSAQAHRIAAALIANGLILTDAQREPVSAEKMLDLLQCSTCFRGDVCRIMPCACAQSLADAAQPPAAPVETKSAIDMIAACYEGLCPDGSSALDFEWARQRGYILPNNGSGKLSPAQCSAGSDLTKVADWLDDQARIATNSLHCGDNSTMIQQTHDWADKLETVARLIRNQPQPTRETVRRSEDALKGWLAYAEENLSEFGVDGESCTGDKLCPSCENSGCIQFKIEETRIALASLALTRQTEGE